MKLVERLKKSLNRIANRRGYRIERIVDYGEDQLDVFELLIEQLNPRSPKFFFVEVGANDGCSGDPVHEFARRFNWRGMLLEPQPKVFEKLVENYRGQDQLTFENVALGRNDGTQTLYSVEGSEYLASFDRRILEKRVADPSRIIKIQVRVKSFQTLYELHQVEHVDLMLVDTEGFDYEVLKMALHGNLPKPRLIRYEHLHLSSSDRSNCVKLLSENEYQLLRDGRDTIGYRREEVEPI